MNYIKPIFKKIRKPLKRLKVFLKQKAGWIDTPKILAYKGYGNSSDVFIQGILIEDKGLTKPKDKQMVWQNILAMIKRFSSDEIAGARIKASFFGESKIMETDELGFFAFHFHFNNSSHNLLTKKWHTVHFELLDTVIENQPPVYSTGEVRIISPEQNRIIVSDIDDTVMISHSTQILRKLRLMLLKNALTRLPFPGIVEFYHALAEGKTTGEKHPLFFVSSSEWNLYDLLDDFFSFNQIPKSVLLLQKLNHSVYKFWKSGGGSHEHKYKKIKMLLEFYPNPKFILIGDSGQQDPLIYTRIALDFPGRIEAIYIRKIRNRSFLNSDVNFYEKLENAKTTYLEVQDTYEAARHASEHGFI
jgi:phosphatidate phosphatase APP1